MNGYNLQKDLHEAQAMVKAMANYVRQDDLYYNIGGNLPRMTLGGFLLKSRRLRLFQDQLTPQDIATLYDVEDQHNEVVDEWRYHYGQKLIKELNSRVDAIAYFLRECADNPSLCRETYRIEAHRRTVIQEVLSAASRLNLEEYDTLKRKVENLDGSLRSNLKQGEFVWDDALLSAYPEDNYWWLYRQAIEQKEGV